MNLVTTITSCWPGSCLPACLPAGSASPAQARGRHLQNAACAPPKWLASVCNIHPWNDCRDHHVQLWHAPVGFPVKANQARRQLTTPWNGLRHQCGVHVQTMWLAATPLRTSVTLLDPCARRGGTLRCFWPPLWPAWKSQLSALSVLPLSTALHQHPLQPFSSQGHRRPRPLRAGNLLHNTCKQSLLSCVRHVKTSACLTNKDFDRNTSQSIPPHVLPPSYRHGLQPFIHTRFGRGPSAENTWSPRNRSRCHFGASSCCPNCRHYRGASINDACHCGLGCYV